MRIGLNLLYLIPGVVGGTATYGRSLVRALGEVDRENEYFLFVNREARNLDWTDNPRFTVVRCPVVATSRVLRYAWEQFVLPAQAWRYRLDVLHSLGYIGPLLLGCRSVVSIHDLNYLAIPEAFSPTRRLAFRFFLPRAARSADAVLTLSESSRDQLTSTLGLPADQIVVTHCAAKVIDSRSELPGLPGLKPGLGISLPYVLAFSSQSPHKNIPALIRGFANLRERGRFQLVLVGHEPTRGESLHALIDALELGRQVVFTGFLDDADLSALLRGATAFAFPSLYEGFGIPILEAMEAGVPVIASSAASIPEVVGSAGLLFDPHSPKEITMALETVLGNSGLRASLIEKGYHQASLFSWTSTAEKVLQAYRDVCFDKWSAGRSSEAAAIQSMSSG